MHRRSGRGAISSSGSLGREEEAGEEGEGRGECTGEIISLASSGDAVPPALLPPSSIPEVRGILPRDPGLSGAGH
jgi:hypothetical protein